MIRNYNIHIFFWDVLFRMNNSFLLTWIFIWLSRKSRLSRLCFVLLEIDLSVSEFSVSCCLLIAGLWILPDSSCQPGKNPITRKEHSIFDGAGNNRVALVQELTVVMNIEIHYQPPYNSNLNPIERLWEGMNEWVRNNRYFAMTKVLLEEIHCFFSEILPEVVGGIILSN